MRASFRKEILFRIIFILSILVFGQSAWSDEHHDDDSDSSELLISEVLVTFGPPDSITITGVNFDNDAVPIVSLGNTPLDLFSYSSTEIVVTCPPDANNDPVCPDGDYLLVVATGSEDEDYDEYDLTISFLTHVGIAIESDPVFGASTAAGITGTDVSNWNTAYGWGDHATAGYLTTESDPVFGASTAAGIAGTDVSNWNTAYGWGDHATAGYLTTEIGDISGVAAGAGLSGGGITGDVSLSVDPVTIQSRVTGACPAGKAIRQINQNGTVSCETDDTGGWIEGGGNVYRLNGNVGIGTTIPSSKLDVNGGINTSTKYSILGTTVLQAPASNLFVGGGAGQSNTTGGENTFLGFSAGSSNTVGSGNTFTGYEAGYSNAGAAWGNTFLGHKAGYSNTDGSTNTFLGFQAGFSNTQGFDNTFSGYFAGYSNTTGSGNTFSGWQAGTSNISGSANTFSGWQAGQRNTTGDDNTFMGDGAGYFNTIGNENSFFGSGSGALNTSGIENTFLGFSAGSSNTVGSGNVFLGYKAGYNETSSDKLYIANSSTNTLIYGDFSTIQVGIGTTNPRSTLQVNGYVQLDLTSGAPPSADCDEAAERGRMIVDNVNGFLYVCVDSGWVWK